MFLKLFKNKETGLGCFGGTGKDSLSRILAPITLPIPIFSDFDCETKIYQEDTVSLIQRLSEEFDIVYLDPPYNEHPYGSNYHILNTIAKNALCSETSRISGIPKDWNRSDFYKKEKNLKSLEIIIKNLKAKYIIISYSSESFYSYEEIKLMLERYGRLRCNAIDYSNYKGGRKSETKKNKIQEYLFVLEKNLVLE